MTIIKHYSGYLVETLLGEIFCFIFYPTSSMFEHFILTHFNTKFKWSNHGKFVEMTPPDEKWMRHRFELFDKYCYPSIVNQSNQNFEWLVLFDGETTDRSLLKNYPKVTPIYLYDYKHWTPKHFSTAIIERLNGKTRWVITSRLDNDDALHQDYIQITQDKFDKKEKLINYVIGMIYDINKKDLRQFNYVCTNPFLSVIESRTRNLKTCFHINHPQMGEVFTVEPDQSKPMWLQIIHDINVGNTLRGRKSEQSLTSFNIK